MIQPSLFFMVLVAQIVLCIVHYVGYRLHTHWFNFSKKVQYSIGGIFLLASFSYSLSTYLSTFAEKLTHTQRLVDQFIFWSTVWVGYLTIFICVALIAFFIYFAYERFVSKKHLMHWGITVCSVVLILNIYGIYNSFNSTVVRYVVQDVRIPTSWENKKIILFTDSHIGRVRQHKDFEKTVNLVVAQKPDYIFIVGDLYDGPEVNTQSYVPLFRKLVAAAPTYFANGNHEKYGDTNAFVQSLQDAGVHTLINESVIVQGLRIVGFDYFGGRRSRLTSEERMLELQRVSKNLILEKEIPTLILQHVPSDLGFLANIPGAVLSMHGHTHKGQMYPWTFIAMYVYKQYVYGLHPMQNMQVLTTSGVGTYGPPQRLGTKSEIVVVTLQK